MRFTFRVNGTNLSRYFSEDWFVGIFLFIGIISLLALAFKIVSRWIYFKKCGEEGWKALIPIYTDITLIKTASLNWWWILILYVSLIISIFSSYVNLNDVPSYLKLIVSFASLISLVSLFAKFNIGYNICKKFNMSVGFAVLIALLEPIGLLILGLSKTYNYNKDVVVSLNGVFKSSNDNVTNNNTNTTRTSSDIEFCENCGNKIEKDTIYCGNCGNKVR